MVIAVASNRLFERLCQCMGQPELASDARFIDDSQRTLHEPVWEKSGVRAVLMGLLEDQVCLPLRWCPQNTSPP